MKTKQVALSATVSPLDFAERLLVEGSGFPTIAASRPLRDEPEASPDKSDRADRPARSAAIPNFGSEARGPGNPLQLDSAPERWSHRAALGKSTGWREAHIETLRY